MEQHTFDMSNVEEEKQCTPLQSGPTEPELPVFFFKEAVSKDLSTEMLVAECSISLKHSRSDEPWNDAYGLELLRRAMEQGDDKAWAGLQDCFSWLVRGWLRRHPKRDFARRLDSEENYVAQTFARFWQATAVNRHMEFKTLAAALQYLRASLNGVILDTLRAYARYEEIMLPESGEAGELEARDTPDRSEVWPALQTMLCDEREKRLAYLLFHCGLKPREIMRFCSQEWSNVREIYRLKRTIMERVLRNADQLRWQLS